MYVFWAFGVVRARVFVFLTQLHPSATSRTSLGGRFGRLVNFFRRPEARSSESRREKPRRRRRNKKNRAELNSRTYENRACAYAHAPSTSVRPSPVSSNPPACHFASRRVSCVAAKATVEVGFASPFSSPRAAVARRAPAVSLDASTNVGVVIFDSVVLVKGCLSLD